MFKKFIIVALLILFTVFMYSNGTEENIKVTRGGDQFERDGVALQQMKGNIKQRGGGMSPMNGKLPVNTALSNVSDRKIISNESDLYEKIEFSKNIYIDLDKKTSDTSDEAVSVVFDKTGLTISSSEKNPVQCIISGSLDGTLTVENSEDIVALVLEGAVIKAVDGPAISILTKEKTLIVIGSKEQNILEDSQTRKENTKKGAVYAKGALIFSSLNSKGSLSIAAAYKNGIYSDDYIKILNGSVSVNVSARDALRCINGFIMIDGNLTLKGTGTVIDDESKGIKVDGEESEKKAGEGFIVIQGGTLTINTVGKAISAGWETQEDAQTETTSDDPNPYVLISGGTLTITTTGKPYEYTNDDGLIVSCSPEGIEAKTDLRITGGNISVKTADDGLNAEVSIIISGGTINVVSSENDAVDSNGIITITGGTIHAVGVPGQRETAFDCNMNPFTITGGSVIGFGGTNMSYPAQDEKSQNTLMIFTTLVEGKELSIKDSKNKTIFSTSLETWCGSLLISIPELKIGEDYTLYNGFEKIEAFQVSTSTTTIGTLSGQGNARHPMMNGQTFPNDRRAPPKQVAP